MKKYFSIFFVAGTLMGCYNVGSYSYYVQNIQESSTHRQPYEQNTVQCDVYTPLVTDPIPEIPIDKIKSVSNKNDKEIQILLAAHIKELREHIVKRRRDETLHYEAYLRECKRTLK